MELIVLGSGGPVPFSNRSAPAFLVAIGGEKYLVDCGPGTGLRLSEVGVSADQLSGVFITHLHMDHCHELPAILFAAMLAGRDEPISVYGPAGILELHSLFFEKAYPYLIPLAKQVTGKTLSVVFEELREGEVIKQPSYRIVARRVKHGQIEAYGFRFEDGLAALALSGDTVICPGLHDLAKGAHTLVQDCALPDSAAGNPIHATPKEVGGLAQSAGVSRVVLTHCLPDFAGKQDEMVMSVRSSFAGEVLLGTDLLRLKLA